ncbi:hypothetical protein HIP83_11490 [Staphylococcus coagulans]|uniref:hypothetical protein n=1 Tax=Staphylococcus TaxID=1279 RepID=UPI0015E60AA9|nr:MULTISPECIES: hypothetical protein [Staphylococcus]MBA1384409.1 hypothetical protein [Staphylococcus aureus]MBS3379497.1 hypothetical protein [Staphylococcus aureus]MBS3384746.1 hypothetical protein [Staphylococcus aureus]MBT2833697.1 hypothetical protein [Staphylococcus coagulans]MCQ9974084.1 hypothetical protein [Staphylococcus aureus]
MGRNSNDYLDFSNTANVSNQASDLYDKDETDNNIENAQEVDHEPQKNEVEESKKEKKKPEYKGELGSILNEESSGHKFIGFNIDMDISDRLDAFCEGKPRGTKTRLVNLILRNGLDNIENKGKL